MARNKTHLIAILGTELWRSCLVGNVQLRERMKRPGVGDLVVEFSAAARGDLDGVGWLRGLEFADRAPGDGVNIDGGRVVDVWLIEPIDKPGETVRWGNATFFAIPMEISQRWLAG
jgi:hypothetical protein